MSTQLTLQTTCTICLTPILDPHVAWQRSHTHPCVPFYQQLIKSYVRALFISRPRQSHMNIGRQRDWSTSIVNLWHSYNFLYYFLAQIPFLKSWFRKMKKVTAFSVAIWYNRCSAETRTEQGLVHNGGCLATNSGFQVTTGYGGAFAGVTTRDSFPPGLKQLFAVTVRTDTGRTSG